MHCFTKTWWCIDSMNNNQVRMENVFSSAQTLMIDERNAIFSDNVPLWALRKCSYRSNLITFNGLQLGKIMLASFLVCHIASHRIASKCSYTKATTAPNTILLAFVGQKQSKWQFQLMLCVRKIPSKVCFWAKWIEQIYLFIKMHSATRHKLNVLEHDRQHGRSKNGENEVRQRINLHKHC